MNILRYDDYPVVPWKNGQGITRDIIRSPKNTEAFDWGLSLADLERSAPFSAFDGYDRTITLIDGNGFTLTFEDGHSQTLDTPFQPYDFDGGAALQCDLIDGPSRVFNLKVRHASAKATWQVHDLSTPVTIDGTAQSTQVLFCLGGTTSVTTPSNETEYLNRWDCGIITDGGTMTLGTTPDTGGAP